jgi:hypothetical protein
MRRLVLLATAAALSGAMVPAVNAQKPPKPPGKTGVTLKAGAPVVTFSQPVALTGSVKGARAGVAVALEERATTATAFQPAAAATTDAKGDYAFSVRPRANTVYRVTAATTPPVQSGEVPVSVRPLVGFRVGDATPSKGQRVRFKGTVRPPHDGMRVSIQRRRADGTWARVRRVLLRDAGDTFSRYGRRIRVRRSGTYRVRIGRHADHLTGWSRERMLTVGG